MLSAIRILDEKKVIAEYVERDEEAYRCPDCNGDVILNKGLKKIHYFRHKTLAQCNQEPESEQHMEIKLDIFNYLRETWAKAIKFIDVEHRIGNTSRADVYFETKKGSKVAIEVQVSPLTIEEVYRRTKLYRAQNVYVLWVLPFEYTRFYKYYTELDLRMHNIAGEPRYIIRDSVKFKEYELGIAKLTFNYLTFWDLTHEKCDSFYVLKLSDSYGADSEYYDKDFGGQVYFSGKRLKTTKSIKSYLNKDIKYFHPRDLKAFNPSNSYTIPERRVLLFTIPKK